jgi:hypothetical protein
MTDPRVDGWYRAVGARATFGFRVENGEVVECAPYGRKIIMGLQWGTAYMKLERGGFTIESLGDIVPIDPSEAGAIWHEDKMEPRADSERAAEQLMAAMARLLREGQRTWEQHQHEAGGDELSAALTATYMAWKYAASTGLLPHGPEDAT